MHFSVQFHFFNHLKDAVQSKDARKVEKTLKNFEDKGLPIAQFVATQNKWGFTLLHLAVHCGNLDILQQLLKYSDGESVNTFNAYDYSTPILLLVRRYYYNVASAEEMLHSLLAAKADPNLMHPSVTFGCDEDDIHRSVLPLVYALQEGLWQMAEILLDAGADPHKQDCHCRPINLCLEQPHLVQRLLDVGCYHPGLLSEVLTANYEGKCEESTLHLCKMILPYHSGPKVDLKVIREAACTGFHEVLLYLLSELTPDNAMELFVQDLPITLMTVSKVITPKNYRRFLSAYFRFLEVNELGGAPYMYLLLTAWNMDLLKILLQEVKLRKLKITGWREPSMNFLSTDFNCDREHENASEPWLWSRSYKSDSPVFVYGDFDLSFDMLSTAAYYISSTRAFTGILPTMLELGLKSSPLALASFAMRASPDEYEFRLTNPEFRDVLTRLSSNCCEAYGSCWFREPFFLALCHDALTSNYHKQSRRVLLTLLRLGVDIGDVFRQEPLIDVTQLDAKTVEIIKHFEPRPMTSWLPKSPTASAIADKFDKREPASLMELSRQAFRSGLGFCRIEEKIEPIKNYMPRELKKYLCFRDHATLAYFKKNKFDPEREDW